jgi:hypothetical protein
VPTVPTGTGRSHRRQRDWFPRDLTVQQADKRAVHGIPAEYPIRGIIHAAMVLKVCLISL